MRNGGKAAFGHRQVRRLSRQRHASTIRRERKPALGDAACRRRPNELAVVAVVRRGERDRANDCVRLQIVLIEEDVQRGRSELRPIQLAGARTTMIFGSSGSVAPSLRIAGVLLGDRGALANSRASSPASWGPGGRFAASSPVPLVVPPPASGSVDVAPSLESLQA